MISLGLFPSWVFGPVMAVTSECIYSWVGVHLPEAYVEKKSLLLDSQVAQRTFTALRLLVCFVKVLSGVHAVCWNQLFLFSCMTAKPPLSCCCGGHGSPVRSLEASSPARQLHQPFLIDAHSWASSTWEEDRHRQMLNSFLPRSQLLSCQIHIASCQFGC